MYIGRIPLFLFSRVLQLEIDLSCLITRVSTYLLIIFGHIEIYFSDLPYHLQICIKAPLHKCIVDLSTISTLLYLPMPLYGVKSNVLWSIPCRHLTPHKTFGTYSVKLLFEVRFVLTASETGGNEPEADIGALGKWEDQLKSFSK